MVTVVNKQYVTCVVIGVFRAKLLCSLKIQLLGLTVQVLERETGLKILREKRSVAIRASGVEYESGGPWRMRERERRA